MYKCYTCSKMVFPQEIKYHTADKTKIFCGAEFSLAYFTELKALKEKENGE